MEAGCFLEKVGGVKYKTGCGILWWRIVVSNTLEMLEIFPRDAF